MKLKNLLMMTLMLAAASTANFMTPSLRIAEESNKVNFSQDIPQTFGKWKQIELGQVQVVDPQQQQTIKRIYSQTLSRTYINNDGYIVMLMIAYGEEQSDSNRLHYPEVCYPAQGFQILSKENVNIDTFDGPIKGKRLLAVNGTRYEPITYWTILGDKVVRGSSELKLEQLRYGLQRKIPDGALIRVSSIDTDSVAAYNYQKQFIYDLTSDVHGVISKHLVGSFHK